MTREIQNLIVGLDIGTSKVVAVAAEALPDGKYEILGFGEHESKGLKKGMVISIDDTVDSIHSALEEAERMVDVKVRDVYTGIAGSHIRSFNSHGVVPIKNKEVSKTDVDRVLETARAVPMPTNHQFISTVAQEFIVDSQEGIREPLGISGIRLEAKAHIVTGAVNAVQNIIKCVRRCGVEVSDIVLQPIASGDAILTDDEKSLGVALVDIGGGTTDIAIYVDGAIRHTQIIPIAGDQITNDIAIGLKLPVAEADDVKLHYGVAHGNIVNEEETFEIMRQGERAPRACSKKLLATGIIEPRVAELFTIVRQAIVDSKLEKAINAGIVLTGGSSLMPGMADVAESIMLKPVRIGRPTYNGRLAEQVDSPRYATVHGLLLEASKQLQRGSIVTKQQGSTKAIVQRIKDWFIGNF